MRTFTLTLPDGRTFTRTVEKLIFTHCVVSVRPSGKLAYIGWCRSLKGAQKVAAWHEQFGSSTSILEPVMTVPGTGLRAGGTAQTAAAIYPDLIDVVRAVATWDGRNNITALKDMAKAALAKVED